MDVREAPEALRLRFNSQANNNAAVPYYRGPIVLTELGGKVRPVGVGPTVFFTPWMLSFSIKDEIGPYRWACDFDDNHFVLPETLDKLMGNPFLPENTRGASVITCASKELAEYVQAEFEVPTYYVPPGIRPGEFEPCGEPDKFTVMWRGTVGWQRALRTVEPYLPDGMVIWGRENVFGSEFPARFERRLKVTPMAAYIYDLKRTKRSVEILPSYDDPYERGKSAIKLYQAMAAGVPCIASALPPYGPEVEHGRTALVYDRPSEIPGLLRELESSARVRREIGMAGREWVYRERTTAKMAEGFYRAWRTFA